MKLLFDQNISPKVASKLSLHFNDCIHVRDICLEEADDSTIWEYAKINSFTIVTKDSDFNNMVSLFGFPPKVIWVKRGNCTTNTIITLMNDHKEVIKGFMNDKTNGILTIL